MTFDDHDAAVMWLGKRRAEISMGVWAPEAVAKARRAPSGLFGEYAEAWVKERVLKPRTRYYYGALLATRLNPMFAEVPLDKITAEGIKAWYDVVAVGKPTTQSHAYGLMRTILGSAVQARLIPYNPCHIRGAGRTKTVHNTVPATLEELSTIVEKMPARYKVMTLLAAWCAMRFGELAELRRGDVDVRRGVVKIRRAVVRVDGKTIIGTPKSDAGTRDVAIPPHLMPMIETHLIEYTNPGKDSLLFPATSGGHMAPSTLYKVYYPAREAAGREDLRWHDLRHTGAVLAAQTGATLAELMGRLGHSTPGAAMRYQHAAKNRDAEIAKALSAMAEGTK